MKNLILGVHAGHNASACIGTDQGLLYAVQEERLCGEKNYWGFPQKAITACLKFAGAKPSDLLCLALGQKQVLSSYHDRNDVLQAYRRHETWIGRFRQRIAVPLALSIMPAYGQKEFRQQLAESGLAEVPLSHYDHHDSHAATAYYGLRRNPQEKYLVLTCDGDGDGRCATVRVWGGGQSEPVAETPWANSLGTIYSWITYNMGFMPLEHEYKLMGMAPYASEAAAKEMAQVFHKYLALDDSGLGFKRGTFWMLHSMGPQFEKEFRGRRFDHICAGLQRFTEDILCSWTERAVQHTGQRKVLAAGGVFMNVKANKTISESTAVDFFEAFPSCGDETLSLGAYYLEAAKQFGDASVAPLQNYYLGDTPTDDECLAELKTTNYRYEKPANMAETVTSLLLKGQPVARCSGPMEFGARALGNRSILADPRNQDVVRVINQMVKKRDFWMPFAPIVKAPRAHDYLRNPKNVPSPYMMMTYNTKENFRDFIAAVHNADLTCRAQLLEREQNPAMYDILEAFEAKTGIGVLLNTSFNLHGFPLVRSPKDALHVLRESGLNHLQLGNYLVSKS